MYRFACTTLISVRALRVSNLSSFAIVQVYFAQAAASLQKMKSHSATTVTMISITTRRIAMNLT